MTKIFTQVGDRIRFYRKAAGMTQEHLGELVQIDQSYLGKIERGEVNISLETIDKISEALNISPHDLFQEEINIIKNEKKEHIEKISIILANKEINEIKLIYKIIKDIFIIQSNKFE